MSARSIVSRIIALGRSVSPANKNELAEVEPLFDRIGRQVMTPYHLRGSLATAYVALSGGTETTLLAGVDGEFHDLVSISAANNSGASATLEIRASTGGTVIAAFQVPANDTAHLNLPVPLLAPFADQSWTIDMADISGTTIRVTALFIKNI